MTPEGAPTTAGNAKAMEISEDTESPVRYFNGELQFAADDLMSGGFADAWGHTRIYSNRLSSDYDFGNGYNWLVRQWAYLVQQASTIVVMRGTRSTLWFDQVGGVYVPRYGAKHSLAHNGSLFVLAAPNGTTTSFNDFTQTANPQGSFFSQTNPGGQIIQVKQYSGPQIGEIQRSTTSGGNTTVESFLYSYSGGDIQSVLLRRQVNAGGWTNVGQATYTYYGVGGANGSLGDLQTATTQNWMDGAWQTTGTSYYRYWGGVSSSSSSGPGPFAAPHLLKFILNPDAYSQLAAAVGNPLSASDAHVAQYADYYFEYDSQRRVTKEVTVGGQYAYTFSFTANANPGYIDDYNNWKTKTVETRPDGSTNAVYTNYAGEAILKQLTDGGNSWIEYSQFDGNANITKYCYPSAIASFNDSQNNLGVALNPSSGLIRTYTYYGSTSSSSSSSASSGTSSSGSVTAPGYLASESVQQGSGGTPVLLDQYQYTSISAGGVTIYPILSQTAYRDDLATQPVTTSHSYAFYAGTAAVSQRTTTLPVVTTAQNGSGIADTRVEQFDQWGNLISATDERGVVTNYGVDVVTGAITQRTDDATGTALVTDFQFDSLGRTTQVLGPSHTVDVSGVATTVRTAAWTVYQDGIDQVWTAQGYATGTSPNYTYTLVNPVSITVFDRDGRTTDEISATRANTSGALSAGDGFPQSSYVRWTHHVYNEGGQLTSTRVYFAIPATGAGSQGVNYNESTRAYDLLGRQNKTVSPGGTITRTVHEARDLVLSVFVGLNDNGATDADPSGGGASGNNMHDVQTNQFDGGRGGGDGNLTKRTLPQGPSSANDRIWTYEYDWRNRQTQVTAPIDNYAISTFDTLDRITQADQYAQGTNNLIARSQTLYDDRGRIYQTIRYAVDPVTGNVGNSLTDNSWYDAAGNVIKQLPAGSNGFVKTVYDNLGRQITQYIGYDLSETTYTQAQTVTGDTIAEQVETAYDDASNVIQITSRKRYHNATGTGPLTYPGGTQPMARVTYVAIYPDAIGRTQAVADYGTNGDASFTRSATIPSRADTILVSSTLYNSRGEAYQSIDPAGLVSVLTFDDAARKTQIVINPIGSSSGSSSSSSSSSNLPVSDDKNNTTLWTYTADSQLATVTALNAATGNQVTTYHYGDYAGSDIARSDLVSSVVYPNSPSDKISYLYNRQSQVKQITDQRGVVHVYDFDSLGRLVHDLVTSLGAGGGSSSSSSGQPGVDASVQRIERTYEVRGMLASTTNYDSPIVGGGNLVTQVQFAYNSFGQLATETDLYATVGSSVSTQYGYADGSANTIRRTSMTYPSGRVLNYSYGTPGTMDDALSRVASLIDNDGVTHLADYTRLGVNTFVQLAYSQASITWSLINGIGVDPYTGLDQFNRVVDNRWFNAASSSSSSSSSGSSSSGGNFPAVDLDRIQHGYDRASNRLWRKNTVADAASANLDEIYAYDGLQRLADLQRGQLNTSNNAIVSGTLDFSQAWGLDATGNWNTIQQYDSARTGSQVTVDNRTHNEVNEITSGTIWGPVTYDAAGNTTILPVNDNKISIAPVYDAWDQMVGDPSMSHFIYDGLGRLAFDRTSLSGYYYSDAWQLIEQRIGASTTPSRQFIWGSRYIDDLVLRDSATFTPSRLYSLQDPNWNVSTSVDPTGTVRERYVYDGYGQVVFLGPNFARSGGSGDLSLFDWETLYAGYRYDAAYSLYLVRHRWYGPVLGRWLTRDPASDETNLYRYALGMPLVHVDPFGLAATGNTSADTCPNRHKATPAKSHSAEWFKNAPVVPVPRRDHCCNECCCHAYIVSSRAYNTRRDHLCIELTTCTDVGSGRTQCISWSIELLGANEPLRPDRRHLISTGPAVGLGSARSLPEPKLWGIYVYPNKRCLSTEENRVVARSSLFPSRTSQRTGCAFTNCLVNKGVSIGLASSHVNYRPLLRNSNSFAMEVIRSCTGAFYGDIIDLGNAPASNYNFSTGDRRG